jgi:hypothetical protein
VTRRFRREVACLPRWCWVDWWVEGKAATRCNVKGGVYVILSASLLRFFFLVSISLIQLEKTAYT